MYLNDVFVGVLNFASWGNRKKNWNVHVIHPDCINEKSITVVCIALFISTFLYFIHFLFSNIKKSSQRMSDYSIKIKGWENFRLLMRQEDNLIKCWNYGKIRWEASRLRREWWSLEIATANPHAEALRQRSLLETDHRRDPKLNYKLQNVNKLLSPFQII